MAFFHAYQYANWQEELLLKHRLAEINNNQKRRLREIYGEQRIVLKRFHTKVWNSQLAYAKVTGDRSLERKLKNEQNLNSTDRLLNVTIYNLQPSARKREKKVRTEQMTFQDHNRTTNTVSHNPAKSTARPKSSTAALSQKQPENHKSENTSSHRPTQLVRPSTVNIVSQNQMVTGNGAENKKDRKYTYERIIDRPWTARVLTYHDSVHNSEMIQKEQTELKDLKQPTTSKKIRSAYSINSYNPFEERINAFCKSIKSQKGKHLTLDTKNSLSRH